ncbi:MAG: VOC family protein [Lachnospiraceae bacterium]
MEQIYIYTKVLQPVEKVWEFYTLPEHITRWNYASLDWHTTKSENDLRPGGSFSSRMEARDGSFGFDFGGVYDEIITNQMIQYTLGDGRKVMITFIPEGSDTQLEIRFDPEAENSIEMQKMGWQAILDSFKTYAENSQRLIPYLWFDKNALEAAELYTSVFPDSKIISVETIRDTPSGDCDMITFQLLGREIQSIGAGTEFKLNSAFSFMATFTSKEEIDTIYNAISKGGDTLMPLGEYPFSPYYVWFSDQYGLNWQLILDESASSQKIYPVLLFQGDQCGKAEAAIDFYKSILPGVDVALISKYAEGEANDKRAIINYAQISALGLDLVFMDHDYGGADSFNEAFSLMISCKDQMEIDYYWNKLSYVPEAEQCGWLKDRFGVSWQVIPSILDDLMTKSTPEEADRVTKAFLKMGKFDIAELIKAQKNEIESSD